MADILCFNKSFVNVINDIESITSTSQLEAFSNFDIFTGKVVNDTAKYATLEKNKWRLDGSYSLIDTTKPIMGYWSEMVDYRNSFTYESHKALEIKFKNPQTKLTMDGITLISGDTVDFSHFMFIILYYKDKEVKSFVIPEDKYIHSVSFDKLDDPEIDDTSGGETYTKGAFDAIEIWLGGAQNSDGRFHRIADIRFGYATWLTDSDFYELSVLEEISLVSDTIPINTLNFKINADKYFMKKLSECDYVELFRDNVQFGAFYLENSEKTAVDQYTVSCSDIIQTLEDAPYEDNLFLTTEAQTATVKDVIDSILSDVDVLYEIDDTLSNSKISIKFTAVNKREALAQILFVANAVCKKLRNGVLWFGRIDTSIISGDITEDLFSNPTVTNNNPVSSLNMEHVRYSKGEQLDTSNLTWKITQKTTDYLIVTISGFPSPITAEDIRINFPLAIVFYQDIGKTAATVNNPYSVTTGVRNFLGPLDGHRPSNEGKYMPEKISVSSSEITIRIDRDVIQRHVPTRTDDDGNWYYIGTRPKTATGTSAIGKDQNITDADTYLTPYVDFTKAELYPSETRAIVTAYALDIATDTETISISNPNASANRRNAQVLDVRTVELAELFIDGKPDNTIDLLMDRYYKYNSEFEGKILTKDFKCGDTVLVTLPDIGETTGTITQLDYTNLTNKLIANSRIWLYYLEE